MKKFNFLMGVLCLLLAGNVAVAQDEEISDEDLRRYALIMEVKEGMIKEIKSVTKEMIQAQEGIDGSRYNELNNGEGEPAKEFEEKFMETVEKMRNDRVEAIKTVNQIMATKMLPGGGKTYKVIKSGLQSDEALKARYEKIEGQLKAVSNGGA